MTVTSNYRVAHVPVTNKVPEATLVFWAIKIMATTVGETGADYLAVHVGLGTAITGSIMTALLIAALTAQLRMRRYVPWIYWLTVVLVSVVGTQITDALTDKLNVPLEFSTIAFALALAATFAFWYRSERTLSIHTIFTRRRELFYWAAILFTFALGTAAGDLATEALGLGFMIGTIIFAAAIALVAASYYAGANAVLTFWIAYILTRPLGASFGDLLSQARGYGGLGLGTINTSLIFLSAIVVMVMFSSVARTRSARAATSGE
ncbi:putative membrane-anchored protein [Paraburkholderia sp. GAS199]|uniref:COG4705 family protein n=1 Tax=Paraburkholderia sp. GAS199 TaxID=3035126 RepID=UPI003D1FB608